MRIAIIEDSTLLREGLVGLLQSEGHEVVLAAPEALTLLHRLPELALDVAVLDVRLPPTFTDEGMTAALQIRREHPEVGVLVLSQYVEQRHTAELVRNGVGGVGYLLKDRVAGVGEFLAALQRVADGGSAFDPDLVRRLLSPSSAGVAALSDREREVLALIAEGLTNQAIADRIHVSLSAVEKHCGAVFSKLGLNEQVGYSPRSLAVLTHLRSGVPPAGGPDRRRAR